MILTKLSFVKFVVRRRRLNKFQPKAYLKAAYSKVNVLYVLVSNSYTAVFFLNSLNESLLINTHSIMFFFIAFV